MWMQPRVDVDRAVERGLLLLAMVAAMGGVLLVTASGTPAYEYRARAAPPEAAPSEPVWFAGWLDGVSEATDDRTMYFADASPRCAGDRCVVTLEWPTEQAARAELATLAELGPVGCTTRVRTGPASDHDAPYSAAWTIDCERGANCAEELP